MRREVLAGDCKHGGRGTATARLTAGHRVMAGADDVPFTLQLHQNQIAGRQIDVDFSL
jgi:hypothetical protein